MRRLPTNIEAGELRHRITIVKPTGVQDAIGGISQTPSQWQTVVSCWGQIETWTGDATLATESFVSKVSHWITIRHPHVLITAQMLVWFNKRTFQVVGVLNPTEQNKLLVLACMEVNDSAQQSVTPLAP